jgi:hypothetical protein
MKFVLCFAFFNLIVDNVHASFGVQPTVSSATYNNLIISATPTNAADIQCVALGAAVRVTGGTDNAEDLDTITVTDVSLINLKNCTLGNCGGFSVVLANASSQTCSGAGTYVVNTVDTETNTITVDGNIGSTYPTYPTSCIVSIQPTADEVYASANVAGLTGMIPGNGSANNGAGVAITDITFNNALSASTEYNIYCATNDATKVLSDLVTAKTAGLIKLYSIKRVCRAGANADEQRTGNPMICSTLHSTNIPQSCLECSSPNTGFASTYVDSCETTNKIRCDARYSSYNAVAIMFKPHTTGVASCGAFANGYVNVAGQTYLSGTPDYHIGTTPLDAIDSTTGLIAKGSVVVDDHNHDYVISLNSLLPDTQYQVYCHMEDFVFSQMLVVHTLVKPELWDTSLTVRVFDQSVSPYSMTLSFKHGSDLNGGDKIVLTTSAAIFSTTDDESGLCSATTLAPGNKTPQNLLITSDDTETEGTTGTSMDVVLGGSGVVSTRDSAIIITCIGALANNPSTSTIVTYDLSVPNHDDLKKQYGYKIP